MSLDLKKNCSICHLPYINTAVSFDATFNGMIDEVFAYVTLTVSDWFY